MKPKTKHQYDKYLLKPIGFVIALSLATIYTSIIMSFLNHRYLIGIYIGIAGAFLSGLAYVLVEKVVKGKPFAYFNGVKVYDNDGVKIGMKDGYASYNLNGVEIFKEEVVTPMSYGNETFDYSNIDKDLVVKRSIISAGNTKITREEACQGYQGEIEDDKMEFIEPIKMKAGNTLILINGRPFPVDYRIISEEGYQQLKEAYDSIELKKQKS